MCVTPTFCFTLSTYVGHSGCGDVTLHFRLRKCTEKNIESGNWRTCINLVTPA